MLELEGKIGRIIERQQKVEGVIDIALRRMRGSEMLTQLENNVKISDMFRIDSRDILVACNNEDLALLRGPLTIPESATINEVKESVITASRSIRESVSTACLDLIEQYDL